MSFLDHPIADAISNALASHQDFVISTHIRPDGDAIGSQLALGSFLQELGKQVRLINRDPVPAVFDFLPQAELISSALPAVPPEVLIVLDAGGLERIGEDLVGPLTPRQLLLNIDHHAHCTPFGDLNLILPSACATAEILYGLLSEYGEQIGCPQGQEISYERAVCLYTGIMYDTGCFRYSNATPAAHEVAARLIEQGIAVDEIYDQVYESIPARKVQLLADVLQTLRLSEDHRYGWLFVTRSMLANHRASEEDLDGFINQVRSIDTVQVAMLFSETKDGRTKTSFRSDGAVDVGALSAQFGGGGHARAAGCTLPVPLDAAISRVTAQVECVLG